MRAINFTLSVVILNANGLNSSAKRWECNYMLPRFKETKRLKVQGWKKVYHSNSNQKRARVAISDKIDFKTKIVVEDKEEHFIVRKGTIHKTFICDPNSRVPRHMK